MPARREEEEEREEEEAAWAGAKRRTRIRGQGGDVAWLREMVRRKKDPRRWRSGPTLREDPRRRHGSPVLREEEE